MKDANVLHWYHESPLTSTTIFISSSAIMTAFRLRRLRRRLGRYVNIWQSIQWRLTSVSPK